MSAASCCRGGKSGSKITKRKQPWIILPNAEAELETIGAVKNETDGRKLVSVVAERFVSATLGVFGI